MNAKRIYWFFMNKNEPPVIYAKINNFICQRNESEHQKVHKYTIAIKASFLIEEFYANGNKLTIVTLYLLFNSIINFFIDYESTGNFIYTCIRGYTQYITFHLC